MNNLINSSSKLIVKPYACLQILRRGFWFIDIPRTSSSSIWLEIGEHFGFPYGKKDISDKQHPTNGSTNFFPSHMTAQEARSNFGNFIWSTIFTFTIVRNPWDRIYSLYLFRKKRQRIENNVSFRDYVISLQEAIVSNKLPTSLFSYPPHLYGSADFILDEDGEIMVDCVVKYENRNSELKFVASRLGIPELGKLHVQGTSHNKAAEHYSEAYDLEMKEIVATIYAKDIDLFNYQFGGEA